MAERKTEKRVPHFHHVEDDETDVSGRRVARRVARSGARRRGGAHGRVVVEDEQELARSALEVAVLHHMSPKDVLPDIVSAYEVLRSAERQAVRDKGSCVSAEESTRAPAHGAADASDDVSSAAEAAAEQPSATVVYYPSRGVLAYARQARTLCEELPARVATWLELWSTSRHTGVPRSPVAMRFGAQTVAPLLAVHLLTRCGAPWTSRYLRERLRMPRARAVPDRDTIQRLVTETGAPAPGGAAGSEELPQYSSRVLVENVQIFYRQLLDSMLHYLEGTRCAHLRRAMHSPSRTSAASVMVGDGLEEVSHPSTPVQASRTAAACAYLMKPCVKRAADVLPPASTEDYGASVEECRRQLSACIPALVSCVRRLEARRRGSTAGESALPVEANVVEYSVKVACAEIIFDSYRDFERVMKLDTAFGLFIPFSPSMARVGNLGIAPPVRRMTST